MLPGAQKWKPRYRRGVITAIDGDTCDLTLTDLVYLTEEKAAIDIDQTLELTGVEIDYMDCNGDAFDVDDAVIVEFTGQDWAAPKVIGFYDAPAPCGIFYYSIVFAWYGPVDLETDWYDHLYFKLDPVGNFTWLTDERSRCAFGQYRRLVYEDLSTGILSDSVINKLFFCRKIPTGTEIRSLRRGELLTIFMQAVAILHAGRS